MWGKRENIGSFQGQSMNFYSTGLELTSRESMRIMPPIDISDRQVMDEASRKRKASDLGSISNVDNDASTRYWADLSSDSGHLLPVESTSQHNVLTIDSQQKAAKMYPDHHRHITRPTNELSQCGDYQFYNTNSSFTSLQRSDRNFQESIVDGSHHKAPSCVIKTPVGTIPDIPHVYNFEPDIGRHSETGNLQSYYSQSVEKTRSDFVSNRFMNSGFQNNNLPVIKPPNVLSSRDLTYLGPSALRVVNKDQTQDGGNYAQDLCKSRLLEVKSSRQNLVLEDDNDLSVHTTNSGRTSVDDRKESNGSYQYANADMRLSKYPSNDNLGAHLNVRDEGLLQLPVAAETSSHEKECPPNGMPEFITLVPDLGTKPGEMDDGLNDRTECHSLGGGASPNVDNTIAIRSAEFGDLDKQSKSVSATAPTIIVERLWDGSLQLNTSTTVSAVAFFKSGEKVEGSNWPQHIEIKGKVRTHAFEKFIQELPRSRNRALMVISLCWKIGSSAAGLARMKEVAKNYSETKRVGFAHICLGFDLYLCPRDFAIITILAKYGFFKGLTAVEEDKDSFIGCVVWRKGPPLNPTPQKSDTKITISTKQPVSAADSSILETVSALPKLLNTDSNQSIHSTREPDNEFVSDTRSSNFDTSRHTTENTDICFSNDLHDAGGIPTSSAQETAPSYTSLTPVQVSTTQQPGSTSLEENGRVSPIKLAEPRGPVSSYEPTQSALTVPPPMLPETQQSSREPNQASQRLGEIHASPAPESNSSMPFNSLVKQDATNWSNLLVTQQSSHQSNQDFNRLSDFPTGPAPELNSSIPFNCLRRQVEPPATQWSNLRETQQSTRQALNRLGDVYASPAPELNSSIPFNSLFKQAEPSATHWSKFMVPQQSSSQPNPDLHRLRDIHAGPPELNSSIPFDNLLKQAEPSATQWSNLVVQSSRQTCQALHRLGDVHACPAPEFNSSTPFNSLPKQAEPSATQWSNLNSQEEPRKLGTPAIAEPKKADMGFDLSRPVFPGPAQLTPEILQNLNSFSRDTHQATVKGTEACERSVGTKEPILCQAPEPLSQAEKSGGRDEGDDLPEFDFSSACGVSEALIGKSPWTGHGYQFPEAPQIHNQLPNVVKNADGVTKSTEVMQRSSASCCPEKPSHVPVVHQLNKQLPNVVNNIIRHPTAAVPVIKPTEVVRRSPASSFPEKSSRFYLGSEELDSKGKFEYQASQSLGRPLSLKVEKGSARSVSGNNYPLKNWDDDDDDMPEWCPPDMEHPQQSSIHRQPSPPIPKSVAERAPRPPLPTQSLSSFHQPQNQGNHHGYHTGLLGQAQNRPTHHVHHTGLPGLHGTASAHIGPVAGFSQSEMRRPSAPSQNQGIHHGHQSGLQGLHHTSPRPAASSQTRPVAGLPQSDMWHPLTPSQNQFSKPPFGKFDNKPPVDVNKRRPRP